MVLMPSTEMIFAGGVVGAAALYGGYKAAGAAARGLTKKAGELTRDSNTSTELGKAKSDQKKSAAERKDRIKELVKMKDGKKKK
jgi:hypothetical protein